MPPALFLLLAGYALLTLAWMMANPPGAAPDETSQYIKALGVTAGKLTGEPVVYTSPPVSPVDVFDRKLRRSVPTPRRLDPGSFADPRTNFACNAGRPEVSAKCIYDLEATVIPQRSNVTNFGTYPPFVYFAPGAVMRLAPNAAVALYFGRAVTALAFLAFLALAFAFLSSDDGLRFSLAGVLVAITPMAVFSGSSLSSSGYEIGAGVAFFAAVIRLARGAELPRRFWLGAGASGVVLAVARPVGPYWIAVGGLVLLGSIGPRRSVERVRRSGRTAVVAVASVAVAVAASLAWQSLVQPSVPGALDGRVRAIAPVLRDLPNVFRQQIGRFGWMDTPLPELAYRSWTLLVVVLVVLAALVGSRRQRLVVAGAIAAVFVVMMALGILAYELYTFPASQGRWVLPVSVAVPLLAAETLRANWRRLGEAVPLKLAAWLAVTTAVVHLVAWYANARRHGVGVNGPMGFFGESEWAPPGGWWLWAAVAVAGAVTVAMAGASASDDVRPAAMARRRFSHPGQ